MKKLLRISPTLALPLDAATSTIVIYGGKGMGKTNLASVLVEEFAGAGIRFAVIDPMGVWWGLRHSHDGKGPGIEVLILGGLHGDLPITPESGALIADLVVDEDASVIVDISRRADGAMWSIADRVRFVCAYTKRIYQRQGEKRRPLNQVIDEAARFAPQVVRQGELEVAACMGAVAVLVEEGRNVGIGVTLVTQRSARLNKDVAELADCMIAFRIVGPNSRRAVLDWLGEHIDKDRIREIDAKLRSLPRGSALVVSPGWLEFEGVVAMRKRTTFDSSKTPELGKEARASGAGAKPDLSKYRARLAELVEQQQANDPKALKAKVADLERQLVAKRSSSPAAATSASARVVEKSVVRDAQLARIEKLLVAGDKAVERCGMVAGRAREDLSAVVDKAAAFGMRIEVELDQLRTAVESTNANSPGNRSVRTGVTSDAKSAPRVPGGRPTLTRQDFAKTTTAPRSAPRELAPAEAKDLAPRERSVLASVAWWHALGVDAPGMTGVAFMAGYSPSSSSFEKARGMLRSGGYIDYPNGGALRLTERGVAATPAVTMPGTLSELHTSVLGRLAPRERKLLQPAIDAYPEAVAMNVLAEAARYSVESSSFEKARGKLRSLGLVDYPRHGEVRAADILFPNGAAP